MVLVGLSMPPIRLGGDDSVSWLTIGLHVLAITFLSNLGKMLPAFCYRAEASTKERIALAIGMFPRGEVGAGVLVLSLSYKLGGPTLTVAILSLALNLLCTGVFILIVKRLLVGSSRPLVLVEPAA
jgi:Kef-type K+ transport system membrane component KefB